MRPAQKTNMAQKGNRRRMLPSILMPCVPLARPHAAATVRCATAVKARIITHEQLIEYLLRQPLAKHQVGGRERGGSGGPLLTYWLLVCFTGVVARL